MSLLVCCWAMRGLVWPSSTGREPWTAALRVGVATWLPMLLVLAAAAGERGGLAPGLPPAVAPVVVALSAAPLLVLPLAARPRDVGHPSQLPSLLS